MKRCKGYKGMSGKHGCYQTSSSEASEGRVVSLGLGGGGELLGCVSDTHRPGKE